MKANELRIGNLLCKDNGDIFTVKRLDETQDVLVKEQNGLLTLGYNLFGIPLTEEWFLRYGFEKINASGLKYYNNGKINIALDFSINYDAGQRVYLKYVHELQNVYIDLIKEELILKTN